MRLDYTIVLEIVPEQGIMHGAGSLGNTSVVCRRTYNVPRRDKVGTIIGHEQITVPVVSGAALKATLREHAVLDCLERAGVPQGSVATDALRLLLKGGKNDGSVTSLSLAMLRDLRDLFPVLAVFGSLDQGQAMRGAIQVSDVRPWCDELVAAGLLVREVTPVDVHLGGEPTQSLPGIRVWSDMAPVPLSLTTSVETHYRHDLRQSGVAGYLQAGETKLVEDKAAARAEKAGKATKEERREANESMPHSAEVITAGTPMVATIRLRACTEAEFGCLATAIGRWVLTGAHLGGGSRTGHGACRVRVAGAIRHDPTPGVHEVAGGTYIEIPGQPAEIVAARIYRSHLEERRARIAARLAGEEL